MNDSDFEKVIKSVVTEIIRVTGKPPRITSKRIEHEGQKYMAMSIAIPIKEQ